VGVKGHPPTFSRLQADAAGGASDRLAGGSLRYLLTSIAEELVGRSLAASTDRAPLETSPEGFMNG
jgi:hypothetical protein